MQTSGCRIGRQPGAVLDGGGVGEVSGGVVGEVGVDAGGVVGCDGVGDADVPDPESLGVVVAPPVGESLVAGADLLSEWRCEAGLVAGSDVVLESGDPELEPDDVVGAASDVDEPAVPVIDGRSEP